MLIFSLASFQMLMECFFLSPDPASCSHISVGVFWVETAAYAQMLAVCWDLCGAFWPPQG